MRHTDAAETPKPNGTHPGIVMHTHRRSFSDEFKREVRALHQSGKRVAEISKATGVNKWSISRMLAAKGTKKVAPLKTRRSQPHTEEFKHSAIARVRKGEPPSAVAKALGVHVSTVYSWTKTSMASVKAARLHSIPATLKLPEHIKDAISFLRHAKREAYEAVKNGDIAELDQAHLLAIMALNSLTKGT
jgi:transposase-like protein